MELAVDGKIPSGLGGENWVITELGEPVARGWLPEAIYRFVSA